ncbi:uncharacterized protein LOC133716534 [Rosa rugosa]|uniref:uncharacterized protein LOC133716534 n=1 Tax=Rosa rugosa TaxID=74645 RepID=UPI002B4076CB|nr:uncharacterized protein LOC133716534 [Rosa rugosa]
MASSSSVSPNKWTSQTPNPDISGLKWTKKNSRHSRQLGNEPQLPNHDSAAELPDHNSDTGENLIDQNEVLSEQPHPKKPNLKVYIRLKLDKDDAPQVKKKAEDQNPKSDDPAVAALAALSAGEGLEEKGNKTWNLRPRKPVKKPNGEASAMKTGAPVGQHNEIPELGRSRMARGCQTKKPKEPRMEISLTLTKEEIEEDLLLLTGKKPSRRPKRRPRSLQKQLDNITPGMYLDMLSAEAYQV